MIFSWPPTGRMTQLFQSAKAINFIPAIQHRRQGRICRRARGQWRNGLRVCEGPCCRLQQRGGGLSVHAMGDSSAHLSLVRTMLPYTLRDPYRIAALHLAALSRPLAFGEGRSASISATPPMAGLFDIFMRAAGSALSLDRMCTSVWGGEDPQTALKKAAAEWDATNQRLGIDVQKAADEQFKKPPEPRTPRTPSRSWGRRRKLD